MVEVRMSAPSSKLIQGSTGPWEIVVGLEVHCQILSMAKLFSGAATQFGADPNSQVSFVDAAMPGMLPVINRTCVEQAVRTGLGLKAKINLTSVFDRKNYFYPDLPAGYQISQYKNPIVGEGEVFIDLAGGETARVGIERLHMEQDAGKSLHDQHPDHSYVDLNRCGVALMEIVSRPDMRSSEEAAAFLKKLRWQHGRRLHARRCQCVGASARRRTRHALRDQERQFHALHRPGDRIRSAPPGRRSRSGRIDQAGNPLVRFQGGRNPLHAFQGRSARLSLFPRS
jgi:aspartyl-tRNA(Asn)/glutamyl-tRNA(Gln) amidotransferase subunit B